MIYLNGNKITFGKFPNEEFYLPIDNIRVEENNVVNWVYENDNDFFKIGLIKGYIDSMNGKSSLYVGYFPHSRMDKINPYYWVSIRTACSFINNLNFTEVTIRDPHSSVVVGLLKNVKVEEWCKNRMQFVLEEGEYDSLFFPDYGAKQRYQNNSFTGKVSYGKKVRDFETGEITSYKIIGDVGTNVLIVDDICSKGGTFMNASVFLKEAGAKKIGLLVSYIEDTIFKGEIFDHVDKIYTNFNRYDNLNKNPKIVFID